MKKIIFAIIFLAVISPVFMHSEDSPSTFYINVSVEKIYPSNQGYIIQYRGQNKIHTIGVPNSWFSGPDGKADIVRLPSGTNWPSMSIFYNDGEFSHVRIYVHRHKSHQTWGNIPQGTDVGRFFSDDDSFEIQFR